MRKLCLGTHKETLKKINTSTVRGENKKTVLQRVETQTTTRDIVKDRSSGEPVIVGDPKEILNRVEVSEKVTFEAK